MKAAERPALLDPAVRRQLALYATIGVLTVTIDVMLFRGLIGVDVVPEVAALVSGAVAMAVHFVLNKYISFKNHDRPVRQQLGTYCAVMSVWWVVTLGVLALTTRVLLVPPVFAKLIAVAINFPLGFLAQRYLTFGPGIAALYVARRKASRAASPRGG